MSDFFLIDRAIFEHGMFDDEPYSKRDAWTWLIGNAAWREKPVVIEGKNIILKRGQLSFSMRFMASKWGWSLSKVQRYTNRLQNDTMIDTQNDTGQLIITICNYDKYQIQNIKYDTVIDTQTDNKTIRKPIQRGNNTNHTTIKEEVSNPLPPTENQFEKFWQVYPKQRAGGKQVAEAAYRKALNRAQEHEIIAGVESYAISDEVARGFAKGAAAWLNDDRWTSDYSQKPTKGENHAKQTADDKFRKILQRGNAALVSDQPEQIADAVSRRLSHD